MLLAINAGSLGSNFLTIAAASSHSLIRGQLAHIEDRNLTGQVLERLAQEGILLSGLSTLHDRRWVNRMEQSGSLATIISVLREFKGSTAHSHLDVVREEDAPHSEEVFVHTARPVLSGVGNHFLTGDHFRPFEPSIRSPKELTPVQGGSHSTDLSFYPPPRVLLTTTDSDKILQMLEYAGIHYEAPRSDAAHFATTVFKAGRNFAIRGHYDRITFDWDHTLSNYQIFEELVPIIKARSGKEEPSSELAKRPMTALEVARPFMQDLALGMMVGYAIQQGLQYFDQWENYEPQVGIVTHTWPDRLGILATHFVRLLPLMEGLLPGTPGMYEHIAQGDPLAIVHLHHFLTYADSLLSGFVMGGFKALNPEQQDEVLGYFEDGKAHYRKPLGALGMLGWENSTLLHFEDSTKVIRDLNHHVRGEGVRGLFVRHPHSNITKDVKEWHKILISSLWRSRDGARKRTAKNLLRAELKGSTMPFILSALHLLDSEKYGAQLIHRAPVPDGILFMLHETPTSVGEYWRYYVEPTNRRKAEVRKIRRERGGIKAIRQEYQRAVASR